MIELSGSLNLLSAEKLLAWCAIQEWLIIIIIIIIIIINGSCGV